MSTTAVTTPAPQDPRDRRPAGRHAAPEQGWETIRPAYRNAPEYPDARTGYDQQGGQHAEARRYGEPGRGYGGEFGGTSQRRTGRTVAVVVAAVLAVAGIAAAGIVASLVIGLGGPGAGDTPPAATVPAASAAAHHAVTPAEHGTGGSTGGGGHVTPPTPPTPPAPPSAAIETLQKELGQLNYYEGPVTGQMNTQTTQAIEYLQRDAGLPQTGQLNAATQAALAHMLATGNNQMGG